MGTKLEVSAMVLDFPNLKPEESLPYMDEIIDAISILKRKKKPFTACYSKNGLEIIT